MYIDIAKVKTLVFSLFCFMVARLSQTLEVYIFKLYYGQLSPAANDHSQNFFLFDREKFHLFEIS